MVHREGWPFPIQVAEYSPFPKQDDDVVGKIKVPEENSEMDLEEDIDNDLGEMVLEIHPWGFNLINLKMKDFNLILQALEQAEGEKFAFLLSELEALQENYTVLIPEDDSVEVQETERIGT